jgi:hypothetical protein
MTASATNVKSGQQEFVELYRAGLKSSLELMKLSLDNVERLQNQQLAAVRAAVEQQSKSSGEQFERLMGYWTGLYEAAGQSQMAALAQTRAWLDEASKRPDS